MQVETIHIDKVANGFLVIFHQSEGIGLPKGATFLGSLKLGEGESEVEAIRRRARENEQRLSGKSKAESIVMKTGEDQYVFLTSELDKMLNFLKFILTSEPEPADNK